VTDPLTVMMIDDNPADGDTVQRYLEDDVVNWTIEFKQAFSAEEALSALREHQFDLLLVDYHFPFGNGFDILRKLRSEAYSGPAIMLTGEGDEQVAGQAVTENLSAYIPKSKLNSESLNDTLETVLTNEGYRASPDVSTESRFTASDDRRVLKGSGRLLSELSSKMTKSNSGLILFEYFRNNDSSRSSDSIISTGRDLESELTEILNGGIRRVNDTVLGAVIQGDVFEDLRTWDESKILSVIRKTLSGDSFRTEDGGVLTLRIHVVGIESTDCDPAQTLNRSLDEFSAGNSDDILTCGISPVGK